MIYTTLYNPAIDLLYRVNDLSTNNTFTNLNSQIIPAGKGLNLAKVVQQLGEKAAVLAIMPEEDLARFEHSAHDFEIDFHPFTVPGSVRINTTIIEDSSGLVQHYNSIAVQYCSIRLSWHYVLS